MRAGEAPVAAMVAPEPSTLPPEEEVPRPGARPPSVPTYAVRAPERPGGPRGGDENAAVADRRKPASFPYVPRRIPCEELARIAREVAARQGLDAGLLIGVMRVESAFAANAISDAAAVGLTQVLPWIGDKLQCGDLFDPASNVDCGAKVLARWLARFDGNLVSALSGYNAGHGMPTRAREERRVPRNFQYVEDVLRNRSRFLRHGCPAWDRTAVDATSQGIYPSSRP